LRVPLLALRAAHSDTFFPKAARNLQRHVPHAIIHTLADTSHLMPMEQPAEVARLIVEFLVNSQQ
jgi:pimeloyl-ACP methyl ester carboxylesterase